MLIAYLHVVTKVRALLADFIVHHLIQYCVHSKIKTGFHLHSYFCIPCNIYWIPTQAKKWYIIFTCTLIFLKIQFILHLVCVTINYCTRNSGRINSGNWVVPVLQDPWNLTLSAVGINHSTTLIKIYVYLHSNITHFSFCKIQ